MMKFLSRLVDSNDREVRRLEPMVAQIHALEPTYSALSDDELMAKTAELKARLRDKVGEYVKAGCTCPVLYPLGADVGQMIDAFRGWDP